MFKGERLENLWIASGMASSSPAEIGICDLQKKTTVKLLLHHHCTSLHPHRCTSLNRRRCTSLHATAAALYTTSAAALSRHRRNSFKPPPQPFAPPPPQIFLRHCRSNSYNYFHCRTPHR
ncbi:hypothetical protein Bca4012_097796 [Brassica carinata]